MIMFRPEYISEDKSMMTGQAQYSNLCRET